MGLKLNGRYILLVLAVQIAYLVQAVKAAGKCDAVFEGFSNCLLKMGKNMANYPQDLDEKENIETICGYWNQFHLCTIDALALCQEGAADVWEKVKRESKKLDIQGGLFELCSGPNGSSSPRFQSPAFMPLLMVSLCALLTRIFF
ncbi:neuritin [Rhinophrynus dorsalis]